jgi:cytochrome c6
MKTRLIIVVAMSIIMTNITMAGDYFNGKKVYDLNCVACHGSNGHSMDPSVPGFADGDALFRPDQDLYEQVRSGSGTMPAFRGVLSDAEIRDVITYIRSL